MSIKKSILLFIFLSLCVVPFVIIYYQNTQKIENFDKKYKTTEEENVKNETPKIVKKELKEKFKINNNTNGKKTYISFGIIFIIISIIYIFVLSFYPKIYGENGVPLLSLETLYLLITLIIGILICTVLTRIKQKSQKILIIIFSIIIFTIPLSIYINESFTSQSNTNTLIFVPIFWIIFICLSFRKKILTTETLSTKKINEIITLKNKDNTYTFVLNNKIHIVNASHKSESIELNFKNFSEKNIRLNQIDENDYKLLIGNNSYNYQYKNNFKPIKMISNNNEVFSFKKINSDDLDIKNNDKKFINVNYKNKNRIILKKYNAVNDEFVIASIIGVIILEGLQKISDIDYDELYNIADFES